MTEPAAFLAEIERYCDRTGTPEGFVGKVAFNHPGFVGLLRQRGTLRGESEAAVRDVLSRFPNGISRADAIAPLARRRQDGRIEQLAPAAFDLRKDGSAKRVTGEQLYEELAAAAATRELSLLDLSATLFSGDPKWKLEQLRMASRPKPATVARIRALIAGKPLPPVAPCRGRKWSGSTIAAEADRVDLRSADEREIMRKRAEADAQREERQRNAREVAEREAAERTARGREARRLTTAHPLDVSDVVTDALIDRIDTARDRRERELEHLPSPSSVLRRAQRDWPDQCARVKALAAELEISLGEAWRRVIGAGVECLTDPEAA